MYLVLLGVLTTFSAPLTAAENPFLDAISVNFYYYPWPWTTDAQKETITLEPGQSAGVGTWLTEDWINYQVPWAPSSPQDPFTIANSKGSQATLNFITCRNGGAFLWDDARTFLPGDGNVDMMDGHINSTVDGNEHFEMTITDIPYDTYDVIIYMSGNDAQFGDGKGKISFNGGPEQDFTLLKLNADESTFNFTEIVDATTPGNYIVYEDVTGSSFTVWTQGNGFNHLGPAGIQFGIPDMLDPSPEDGDDQVVAASPLTLSWTNLPPVDANFPTTVDVYFSTDPCNLGAPIAEDAEISSIDVDASALGTYYWMVETYNGSDANGIPSDICSFTTVSDPAPVINSITPDQMGWSGEGVPVTADVTNLGSAETIYAWTVDADPRLDVVITDGDTATATITVTKQPYTTARIVNASFEEPDIADGGGTAGANGWTVSGYGGVADPATDPCSPDFGGSFMWVEPTDGEQCGWANPNTSLSQVPGETFAEGATYNLSVDVGYGQWSEGALWKTQLIAVDGQNEIVVAEESGGPALASELQTWRNSTVDFTVEAGDPCGVIGLPIKVKLVNAEDTPGGVDVEFDNVVLSTDTPFPAMQGDVDTVTVAVAVSDAENIDPVTATMEIDVYDDACAVSRDGLGLDDFIDLDKNCEIGLSDLVLVASTWLKNTSLEAATASPDQAEQDIVFNGDFQTIVKPGTTMSATINDGNYFSIGNQSMNNGLATYADGTTGTGIELPGWVNVLGGTDCMQAGSWGGPDGSGDIALLVFGTWGGPSVVESSAPLSLPVSGPGGEFELSADVYHTARPIVLDLVVDGVVVEPDTASSPAGVANDWVQFTRTYSSVPAGDAKIVVGTRNANDDGWDGSGNRASIDNINLTATITSESSPTVDAGENMITWSDQAIQLASSVTNNDPNDPQGELNYLWTAKPEDGVVFDPGNGGDPNSSTALAPTVTVTKPEGEMATVKLTLSVSLAGSETLVYDAVTVDVYDNPCLAGVAASPEGGFAIGDLNTDCITNLDDYALLAVDWLTNYLPTGSSVDKPEE